MNESTGMKHEKVSAGKHLEPSLGVKSLILLVLDLKKPQTNLFLLETRIQAVVNNSFKNLCPKLHQELLLRAHFNEASAAKAAANLLNVKLPLTKVIRQAKP